MRIATFMIVILIFAGILIPICTVLLQIYLSRKQNKWFGLILPIIPFCYSILTVLNFLLHIGSNDSNVFLKALPIFLGANIPTIILLLIYYVCRRSIKPRAQLDKMNIQDLD